MPILPPAVRPSRALADLRRFFGARRRHQIVYVAAAAACTVFVMWAVYAEFDVQPEYRPPEITYVTQWPASRSDADVRAQLAKDAPREHAAKAAEAAAAEAKRKQFQRWADAFGIR